jgi:DNA ligase (NAD+)
MDETESIESDKQTLILLRIDIKKHNYLYYNEQPVISDEDYDIKFRYLQRLEGRFPEMNDPTSPTQTVGAKA